MPDVKTANSFPDGHTHRAFQGTVVRMQTTDTTREPFRKAQSERSWPASRDLEHRDETGGKTESGTFHLSPHRISFRIMRI